MSTFVRRVSSISLLILAVTSTLRPQSEAADRSRFSAWFPYQCIPNLVAHLAPARTTAGLEWECAPLLYSWGINPKTSPWYSFIVVPTARFSGSVEWNVGLQLYAGQVGRSHLGASTHLMSYFPLSDAGELAGLNLGVGAYVGPDGPRFSKAVGLSTAFGMLHLNVKHLDRPAAWVTSLEVRIY